MGDPECDPEWPLCFYQASNLDPSGLLVVLDGKLILVYTWLLIIKPSVDQYELH